LQDSAEKTTGKLFTPALVIAFIAATISLPMLSMLTVDIANTFFGNAGPVSLGLVAQVNTINRSVEILFALAMGALTVRFRNKPLLLLGSIFLLSSAVGSFLAPTLWLLEIWYALEGAGTVMISINAFTLIGRYALGSNKPKVVSYVNAVGFGGVLLLAPLLSFITNNAGWRYNYLLLVLPLAFLGLILAYFGVPAERKENNKTSYFSGFKEILRNKYAVACILSGLCGATGNIGILTIAFYRQQFLSNTSIASQVNFSSMFVITTAIVVIITTLLSGYLTSKIGAIRLTIIGSLGNALILPLQFFMPDLWTSAAMGLVHVWFFGMAATPWSCLALDQVPAYRGTMMSFRAIIVSLGAAMATLVGGTVLATFGSYQLVGIALALVILPAAPLIFVLTKDPHIKTPP